MSSSAVLDELAAPRDVVRVLLVEDDPGDRRLVAEMLRDAGDAAVMTSCGRISEAQDPVSRGLADLVLLDLSLPDADGLDGLRQLRATAPEVPVVVLSGLTDERIALEAVQAGAQDYLMKGEVDSASLRRAERCGAAGDEVLVEVARRLREQLRGVDTVARLGGDEFVVLCEGVADEQAALALADRLCRALEEPCAVTGGPAEVSAAIGVAVARRPGGRRVAPAPRRRGDVRRKARRRRARRARRRSLSGRMVETAKGPVEVVELTRAQQAAVRRAAEARATVPAFSVGLDAAVPAVPALVAAAARALRAHPAVNGAYRDGRLERYGRVNVAVVVPGPEVPLSPVVFDADTKPVATIEAEVAALAARAAAGELTAPEQAGATFTVLHVPAVTRVEPVLPPGAAAALGAGAGALTLACDARALTAVAAAAFLAALVEAAA